MYAGGCWLCAVRANRTTGGRHSWPKGVAVTSWRGSACSKKARYRWKHAYIPERWRESLCSGPLSIHLLLIRSPRCSQDRYRKVDRGFWFTEQRTFTDGRIILIGNNIRRGKHKRSDYLLCYRRDYPIAVVEAKADYKSPSDGLQQAKDYAQMLGLKFAYSTNGTGIVGIDFTKGLESHLTDFPTPSELWSGLQAIDGLNDNQKNLLLAPCVRRSSHISHRLIV